MDQDKKTLCAIGLLLPNIICEMLSLCTSEERRDLYKGLTRVSNRASIGAIFNALYKGSDQFHNKREASRITAAMSIPAHVIINNLLAKGNFR